MKSRGLTIGVLGLATSVANATITWDFNSVFAGTEPGGNHWANLLIVDDRPNKVDFTLNP